MAGTHSQLHAHAPAERARWLGACPHPQRCHLPPKALPASLPPCCSRYDDKVEFVDPITKYSSIQGEWGGLLPAVGAVRGGPLPLQGWRHGSTLVQHQHPGQRRQKGLMGGMAAGTASSSWQSGAAPHEPLHRFLLSEAAGASRLQGPSEALCWP